MLISYVVLVVGINSAQSNAGGGWAAGFEILEDLLRCGAVTLLINLVSIVLSDLSGAGKTFKTTVIIGNTLVPIGLGLIALLSS